MLSQVSHVVACNELPWATTFENYLSILQNLYYSLTYENYSYRCLYLRYGVMSDMKTVTVRAIALAALLLLLALSEDSSFIALWQVPQFYIIRIYTYYIQCIRTLYHKNIYILHTVYKALGIWVANTTVAFFWLLKYL